MKLLATAKVNVKPSFPRKFAPGAYWFSGCLDLPIKGVSLHNHNSCFLLMGSRASVLIDTGPPFAWNTLQSQIISVLDGRVLDYIFVSHPEAPHMGNAELLLQQYPAAQLVGDLRNYELYLPDFQNRFLSVLAGDSLDLGGRKLLFIEAAVHDLPNTLWAYESENQILFVSDAFPYTHQHHDGQCAMTSEELPTLPRPEDAGPVIESALNWTHFVDAELTIGDLDATLKKYPPKIIAPAHGGVITQPSAFAEVFREGLRLANRIVP